MADQSTRPMRIGCAFTYSAEADTPAVFQVRPRDGRGVRVLDENWSIQPAAAARHYRDLYGNPCLRVRLPAGRSGLCYDALAEVPDANEDAREVPPDELPDEVLLYTLPSRYILPDGSGEHLDLRPRQPTTQQLSTKPKSRPRGEKRALNAEAMLKAVHEEIIKQRNHVCGLAAGTAPEGRTILRNVGITPGGSCTMTPSPPRAAFHAWYAAQVWSTIGRSVLEPMPTKLDDPVHLRPRSGAGQPACGPTNGGHMRLHLMRSGLCSPT